MAKDKKIIDSGKACKKVDHQKVAKGLGAHLIDIPELTKGESEKYEPAGPLVPVPDANPKNIYYHGSRKLIQCGKSLDDVIGYRVLDFDEEQEFRQKHSNKFVSLVQFYQKPQK